MSEQALVCSLQTALTMKLDGSAPVIRTERPDRLREIRTELLNHQMKIRCLLVKTDLSLEEIPFDESWEGLPIALQITRIGRYRTYARMVPRLRKLNIRIYAPAECDENLTGFRILASLGVETALTLTAIPPDWEKVTDLMTYALLGLSPHAGIEPFLFIGEHYEPASRTEFGAVYFDDPTAYLHLDEKGRVYVSPHDLQTGRAAVEEPFEIEGVEKTEAYRDRMESWRQHFVAMDACSVCPGWRLCGGTCARFLSHGNGCSDLFTEMMDVVEQYQAIKSERVRSAWQP